MTTTPVASRADAAPAFQRALLACIGAWSVLALASTFLHGPLPLYSTRTLGVAWEMWDRGSWLVPIYNGLPYSHKTPLLPWLIHAGWAVFGVGDGWPRVLQVLQGACLVAQTAWLARRLVPERPQVAVLAAWALAGSWFFFLFSLQLMYEVLLACTVLGGLLALCRRDGDAWRPSWPGFALAVGLGLLAKGPVALLHLGVPLLAARWWHPAAQARPREFARGAVLAVLGGLALFALWLVPAVMLGDPEYRRALLVTQTAGRVSSSFDHAEPVWWYVPALLALAAPWWTSAWWWRQLPQLWRLPAARMPWIWILGVVVAFSLISGKQAYYLLPEIAGFALLLGMAADARPRLGIAAAAWLLAIGVLALAAPLLAARHADAGYPPQLATWLQAGGAVLVLVGLALLRWRSLPAQAGGILLGVAVLHAACTPLLREQFDVRPMASALADAQRAGTPVAYTGTYHLQFHFAGRLRQPIAELDRSNAREWARAHPSGLIVAYTPDPWTGNPGPVIQARARSRWEQAWRAADWLALPPRSQPVQAVPEQLRSAPR
jgi:4-amino-4-deoxy-L-arabinose transferase-like glycosyltransferase